MWPSRRSFSSVSSGFLGKLLREPRLLVSNKNVTDSRVVSVADPGCPGRILGRVDDMGLDETRVAIDMAHKTQMGWQRYSHRERSKILASWHSLIQLHASDLATVISAESGKPLQEALKEVAYGAAFVQWFAEEAPRINGDIIPSPPHLGSQNSRILVYREPVGPCALITPWNFPLAMLTRKAGAALAAGCTVVTKPAPETPLTALALSVLADEAGIPKGVLNLITTSKERAPEIGLELCTNPMIKKVSFTGSTAVGKLLSQQCSSTVKRLSLELGGNAPFIIFEDADLDQALTGLILAKFRNAGQTCVAANRVSVHDSVYDTVCDKLVQRVSRLKVGHGIEDYNVDIGPLISKHGLDKVHAHVQESVKSGAKVLVGGKHHSKGGLFYEPTVLRDVSPNALIAREETFGPVAALIRFKTEEEVISWANDTPSGLAGYFYSRDVSRIFRVAEALQVGMVGVNEAAISTEVAPFGGIKESGLGREGSHLGIQEYLNVKYVCLGGLQ